MKKIIYVLVLLTGFVHAQSKWDIFPSDLNVQPFTANFLEPKLGFVFTMNENSLRLDIGNSLDAIHYNSCNDVTWSFGFDLFTYTLLRGETDFHFPVDAVDYLFGVNVGYLNNAHKYPFGVRLRLSHISAHFVDGHYDGPNQMWRGGLNPRVYSREFIEVLPFVKFGDLRVYGGLTYIFHVDPSELGADIWQAGFDYFKPDYIADYITPFAGYDFKYENLTEYKANHSVMAGVKFGNPHGRGISIYFQYYSGRNIHGEYFDFEEEFSAFGMNIDL
ncbi:MAG: hypothetical protein SCALA702_12350 [Melioribacteraceae bacterium]|nr:MAG: hypothetical protein SCALA702_12350 [Melioribacteraceae bacterium]